MGSVLSVDDIEIGQIVALHSFKQTFGDFDDDDNNVAPPALRLVPLGVPLRVKGMSLPYVACELISPGGKEGGPAIVDVRRARVCRLDREYIDAIVNLKQKKVANKSFDNDVPF